jgi:hypothetical protein
MFTLIEFHTASTAWRQFTGSSISRDQHIHVSDADTVKMLRWLHPKVWDAFGPGAVDIDDFISAIESDVVYDQFAGHRAAVSHMKSTVQRLVTEVDPRWQILLEDRSAGKLVVNALVGVLPEYQQEWVHRFWQRDASKRVRTDPLSFFEFIGGDVFEQMTLFYTYADADDGPFAVSSGSESSPVPVLSEGDSSSSEDDEDSSSEDDVDLTSVSSGDSSVDSGTEASSDDSGTEVSSGDESSADMLPSRTSVHDATARVARGQCALCLEFGHKVADCLSSAFTAEQKQQKAAEIRANAAASRARRVGSVSMSVMMPSARRSDSGVAVARRVAHGVGVSASTPRPDASVLADGGADVRPIGGVALDGQRGAEFSTTAVQPVGDVNVRSSPEPVSVAPVVSGTDVGTVALRAPLVEPAAQRSSSDNSDRSSSDDVVESLGTVSRSCESTLACAPHVDSRAVMSCDSQSRSLVPAVHCQELVFGVGCDVKVDAVASVPRPCAGRYGLDVVTAEMESSGDGKAPAHMRREVDVSSSSKPFRGASSPRVCDPLPVRRAWDPGVNGLMYQ